MKKYIIFVAFCSLFCLVARDFYSNSLVITQYFIEKNITVGSSIETVQNFIITNNYYSWNELTNKQYASNPEEKEIWIKLPKAKTKFWFGGELHYIVILKNDHVKALIRHRLDY